MIFNIELTLGRRHHAAGGRGGKKYDDDDALLLPCRSDEEEGMIDTVVVVVNDCSPLWTVYPHEEGKLILLYTSTKYSIYLFANNIFWIIGFV